MVALLYHLSSPVQMPSEHALHARSLLHVGRSVMQALSSWNPKGLQGHTGPLAARNAFMEVGHAQICGACGVTVGAGTMHL